MNTLWEFEQRQECCIVIQFRYSAGRVSIGWWWWGGGGSVGHRPVSPCLCVLPSGSFSRTLQSAIRSLRQTPAIQTQPSPAAVRRAPATLTASMPPTKTNPARQSPGIRGMWLSRVANPLSAPLSARRRLSLRAVSAAARGMWRSSAPEAPPCSDCACAQMSCVSGPKAAAVRAPRACLFSASGELSAPD